MTIEQLEQEALNLNPESRARLAQKLLFSLDKLSESEIEDLWIAEAIRRDDEMDAGRAKSRPAAEVLQAVRARLG